MFTIWFFRMTYIFICVKTCVCVYLLWFPWRRFGGCCIESTTCVFVFVWFDELIWNIVVFIFECFRFDSQQNGHAGSVGLIRYRWAELLKLIVLENILYRQLHNCLLSDVRSMFHADENWNKDLRDRICLGCVCVFLQCWVMCFDCVAFVAGGFNSQVVDITNPLALFCLIVNAFVIKILFYDF